MKRDFWVLSLIALWIIASVTGWDIYMRIAVAANAVLVLINVITECRRLQYGQ